MNEILYGIGRSVIEPFSGTGDVIAAGELKDLNVSSTFSMEDVTGGNKMFPLASFPKDKSMKVSATNAKFSIPLLQYQDGVSVAGTANSLVDVLTFRIPSTSFKLPKLALTDSVKINGFTVVAVAPTVAGTFQVTNATDTTITVVAADVGKLVDIKYSFTAGANAKTYEAFQTSMQKPFKFTYVFDVYDDNNTKVYLANLVIYKALCTSGFTLDFAHQTASTQKFELEARDPQRLDEKLWDITFNPVV